MSKLGVLFAVALLMWGCFSRPTMMTRENFDQVQIGSSINSVIHTNGEPYSVHEKNGKEEYVYIERVTTGNTLIFENHYILYVQNGMVVGKDVTQEKNPPFDLIYQDDPNHNQYP